MFINGLSVEYRRLSELRAYERKLRVHPAKQRAKMQASLARYGQLLPVLIDHENVIIDGHLVVEMLSEVGADQAAVVVIKNRNPAEIKAIRLMLNRLPQDGGWNNTDLKAEFEDLLAVSFDMSLTAFDTPEIDMALSIDDPSSGEVEDAPPKPADGPTVAQPGEIWALGDHRVACGDARDAQLLARLMDGASAQTVFTDPPYNVRIGGFVVGKGRHREFGFASGEMSKPEFTAFLTEVMTLLDAGLADGAVAFVCMDWRHVEELLAAVNAVGLTMLNLCVWSKTNPGMGSLYRSQHELVFVLKKGAAPHLNNVELGKHGRARSNLWTYRGMSSFGADRDALLGSHPTVKPVALVADAIKDVSRRRDLVFDPFLGSGTTLVAAHRTGRRCYGVELDPAYVDVIIRRWEAETGGAAVLMSSGETFETCSEVRQSLASPVALLAGPGSAEG